MVKRFSLLLAVAFMAACSGTESSTSSDASGGGDPGSGGSDGSGGSGGSGGSDGSGGSGGADGSGGAGGGSAEAKCPDLSGVFACPPFQDQPAYTLTVTQQFDGKTTTTYQLHYSFNNETVVSPASPSGISTDGHTRRCVPYMGVDSMASYPDGMPAKATYNFINADNDYQADYGGSTAIICVRSP